MGRVLPAGEGPPAPAGTLRRERHEAVDERALAARAVHDPEAFVALYRSYVGPIYEFAYRRCRSKEMAEDVTSATFEKALSALDRFEWRQGGFRSWLYRIAANELTDQYRRQRRDTTRRAQRTLQLFGARALDDDLS